MQRYLQGDGLRGRHLGELRRQERAAVADPDGHLSPIAGHLFSIESAPALRFAEDHASQGSIVVRLRDSLGEYLASAKAENADLPESIQELEKQAGIRLVITDRQARPRVSSARDVVPFDHVSLARTRKRPLVCKCCLMQGAQGLEATRSI